MTQAHHLLGRNESVGDYANQPGHDERNKALDSVEPKDVLAEADTGQKHSERDKVRAPYGKFKEAEG